MISRGAITRHLREHLWYGPGLAGVFAVGMSVVALVAGSIYGDTVDLDIGQSELVSLLGIFATSMLTVATFTISAIVTSATSVSNSTTPRAARLVLSDGRGQTVLSAFIAAFMYSVIGILALQAFDFQPFGRFILFCGLIVIVAVVLVAFVGWIDRVLKLGRQETMIERLVSAALESMTPDAVGTFGARRWDGVRPPGSRTVNADRTGFVAEVNVRALQLVAEDCGLDLIVATRPGEILRADRPVAYVVELDGTDQSGTDRPDDDEIDRRVCGAIETANLRQYEHDVRFNLVNLAETADRALSPGVNDPGTAINVLFTLTRAFERWAEVVRDPATRDVRFDRVSLPPLTAEELVTDAFTSIARDGAGAIEVVVRLHKTLQGLGLLGVPELGVAARQMAAISLELSDGALASEAHRHRLHDLAVTDV